MGDDNLVRDDMRHVYDLVVSGKRGEKGRNVWLSRDGANVDFLRKIRFLKNEKTPIRSFRSSAASRISYRKRARWLGMENRRRSAPVALWSATSLRSRTGNVFRPMLGLL